MLCLVPHWWGPGLEMRMCCCWAKLPGVFKVCLRCVVEVWWSREGWEVLSIVRRLGEDI